MPTQTLPRLYRITRKSEEVRRNLSTEQDSGSANELEPDTPCKKNRKGFIFVGGERESLVGRGDTQREASAKPLHHYDNLLHRRWHSDPTACFPSIPQYHLSGVVDEYLFYDDSLVGQTAGCHHESARPAGNSSVPWT
ncbi:MAG: hypothetical protein AB7H80_13760, partial [Candidatus Kapaibacterium sp.]